MDTAELAELEHKGWQALSGDNGAEFYDAFMADEAMMALPFGVLDRDACVEAIAAAPPWSRFELSDMRVVVLNEEAATVVYTASAQREGQPEYRAVMSTTYVRRDGEWLIALHQQTPSISRWHLAIGCWLFAARLLVVGFVPTANRQLPTANCKQLTANC